MAAGKETPNYKDRVAATLSKLIEKERVYSKVSGVTFGFIRYKRAAKELLLYDGRMESAADLCNVKHIGKSIADKIAKELEDFSIPPAKQSFHGNNEDEPIVISDHSSILENPCDTPFPQEKPQISIESNKEELILQDKSGLNKFKKIETKADGFTARYAQSEVEIQIKAKQTGNVFTVKTSHARTKVPIPYALGHLILDTLAYDALECKPVDTSSLRYLCLERARKHAALYGSGVLFESTEKKVKHFAKILLRHALIEESPAGVFITNPGMCAATLLSSSIKNIEQFTKKPSVCAQETALRKNPVRPTDTEPAQASEPLLLIDIREKRSREDPYFFHTFLSHAGVKAETRVLSIGDFLWAHIKNSQELYCKVLIERKTIRDLLQSVRDGRYREQKERLVSLPGRKIYCIEGSHSLEKSITKMIYTVTYSLIASRFMVINPRRVEETLFTIEKIHGHVANEVNTACLQKKETERSDKKEEGLFLLDNLLARLHRKKLTDYTETEQSLIVLQAIKGVSQSAAINIVLKIGKLSDLIKKSQDRSSLLEELAAIPGSKRNRQLGPKKAQSILLSLGL
ncbi:hypothetical protein NEAUS07_1765 [Nematocida ausubeli]|nr:hypothetical protein NEAUS07_1765 [Nematocida ausubeli]